MVWRWESGLGLEKTLCVVRMKNLAGGVVGQNVLMKSSRWMWPRFTLYMHVYAKATNHLFRSDGFSYRPRHTSVELSVKRGRGQYEFTPCVCFVLLPGVELNQHSQNKPDQRLPFFPRDGGTLSTLPLKTLTVSHQVSAANCMKQLSPSYQYE